eukprot:m.163036 g.163036  ORF g.163036 m.163036 type:complete len:418 (+) comp17679_c2_seq3:91-1344(+)
MAEASGRATIAFDVSKKELFSPSNGLKGLQRRLRGTYKVTTVNEVSLDKLSQAQLCVFNGPRDKFTAAEFDAMRHYMDRGGSIMLLLGEGGESKFDTNVNFLLEEYGIMVNTDSVVRSSFYKYLHPKECLVTNGVLNRELNRAAGKRIPGLSDDAPPGCLSYVYPYGATLTVEKPAIPVLSSGTVALPLNRPTCALHTSKGRGKLCVLGSCHVFQDAYVDKEENGKLLDILLQWLLTESLQLNAIDAEDPDVSDYHFIPDVSSMADKLQVCLQEGDDVPKDFTKVFDTELFQLDTSAIPDVIRAYDNLGVTHEHQLQLIPPQFETPLPPLQPAVFPPQFQELEPPALDLFDLDDNFSSERVRLAQVTNKCNDDDLEYYLRECGDILGVTSKLDPAKRDGKHVLEYILRQVAEFKKQQ